MIEESKIGNIKPKYKKVIHLSFHTCNNIKTMLDIYLALLTNAISKTFFDNCFPKELKKAEIMQVYKKNDPLKSGNNRSASLLPYVSKIFERLIDKQIKVI